jgi:hypothetical protein
VWRKKERAPKTDRILAKQTGLPVASVGGRCAVQSVLQIPVIRVSFWHYFLVT